MIENTQESGARHEGHPLEGVGQRLREAREAKGLGLAEVSSRLKMPLRVVQSLEAEDWARLGAPVFVRGQLRSYARLLGIDATPVEAAAGVAVVEPPVLVPRTYTSPLQRFAEHAARRAVYIVMTVAIAIPVWLATRPQMDLAASNAAPLDAPASPQQRPAHSAASRQAPSRAASPGTAGDGPHPLVASLAALPPREAPALSLQFEGDSWARVIGPDGQLLEQALLHAGDRRNYAAGEVGAVVLGNAGAVRVSSHGRTADLAPYLRANVARFTVSSDGSLAPAVD
jgi:cytoskeleton protein RodZ